MYDWQNTVIVSDSRNDRKWREQSMGKMKGERRLVGEEAHQKEVFHAFKAAPEKDIKEEAFKKEVKESTKTVQERMWYSQEALEHGGLRIKDELKEEEEEGPQKKRVKKE